MNPAVLILDDSTSSVDAGTEHLIRQALSKLVEGRTTFVITHRLSIIRNADLILMLKDGRIVEHGTHENLMAANGLYRDTYLAQLASQDSAGTPPRRD
jgi:ABC-type multidrug transport system fused ATPase/permease subunit